MADAKARRDANLLRLRLDVRGHRASPTPVPTDLRAGPSLEHRAKRQAGHVLLCKALAQVLRTGPLDGPLAARRGEDRGGGGRGAATPEGVRGARGAGP